MAGPCVLIKHKDFSLHLKAATEDGGAREERESGVVWSPSGVCDRKKESRVRVAMGRTTARVAP